MSEKRVAQILIAALAGRELGSFKSERQASDFYERWSGPLPFATLAYDGDAPLVRMFVACFTEAFETTGIRLHMAKKSTGAK